MEWISVNDKLPEYDVDVLVFLSEGRFHQDIDYLQKADATGHTFAYNGTCVTHLMPLPEPPKTK